jgi:hypothetical protein
MQPALQKEAVNAEPAGKPVKSDKSSVETPLDELLQLIMNKGSVKISDAARQFNVKEGQIEEWARILEQHDLIELHYPTIGRPTLKRKHVA